MIATGLSTASRRLPASLSISKCLSTGGANTQLVKSEIRKIDGHGIGIITLCDPKKLNALTVNMGDQFVKVTDEMAAAARKQEIRACIFTGEGDAFSAGGDLDWLRERHTTPAYLNSLIMVDFYNRFLCLRKILVPTIAAINGPAIGAGLCMTLACDIRLVANTAKLGFTFPKLGIHPGMGASVLLPRLIRTQDAAHLLMSGEIISGADAKTYGLALRSIEKDKLMQSAIDLALEYSKNSPIAVQTCMQTLRHQKFVGLDEGLQREADSQAHAYAATDLIRGLDAIKAKKSPAFEGW